MIKLFSSNTTEAHFPIQAWSFAKHIAGKNTNVEQENYITEFMVFSPRLNLRAKAFFQMQDSWEKVQGQMMGQRPMNVHLVMQRGVPLPGHRGTSVVTSSNHECCQSWRMTSTPQPKLLTQGQAEQEYTEFPTSDYQLGGRRILP